MENIKSSLIYPLFKSFLPLFVGGSYHLCKQIFTNFSLDKGFKPKLDDDGGIQDDHHQKDLEEMPSDLFSMLNQLSFGIYMNLFAFLFVMFLIEGIIKIIQLGMKGFWKNEVKSIDNESSFSLKRRGIVSLISKKGIMKIFVYTLIFTFFQISGLCFSLVQSQTSLSAIENSQNLLMMRKNDFQRIPRILEEEEEFPYSENEQASLIPSPSLLSDKISLSMGSILSSLNLNVKAMVLSKDRKLAYVTLDFYWTLKIIDISDLQSPFVVGTLGLEGSMYQIKNLLLSSDEKTLYASNSRELEIIDVADPSSPKLISSTKSQIFTLDLYGYMKTSLVIEENTKTLYIGGQGLEVYDISNPKKPALLKSIGSSNVNSISLELCLSRNGKVLFVANGTLNIYNVSNPSQMELLDSFNTESSLRSILLSEDGKTAFLLGTKGREILFEEVDISDYKSLKVLNTTHLGHKSSEPPRFLAVSPNKAKFFIMTFQGFRAIDLLVFNRMKKTTIKNEKNLIEDTLELDFSPDGKTLITASSNQFLAIELSLDYPNRQIFSESLDNLISKFDLPGYVSKMQISNDGNYLFILRGQTELSNSFYPIFEIWDVRNPSGPRNVSSYIWEKSLTQIYFTKDQETAYLMGDNEILVLDIKNRSSINTKKIYKTQDSEKKFLSFTTSSDEKTGFVVIFQGESRNVTAFDLSDASPSIIEANTKLDSQFIVGEGKLVAKDDKTLIIVLRGCFLIYEISSINSLIHKASLPFGLNEPDPETTFTVVSPDKRKIYIERSDRSTFHKLKVYDLSTPASPQLVSEKYFSKLEYLYRNPGFSLSPADPKTGFLYKNNSLVKLDLKNLKEMKVSGVIPLSGVKKGQIPEYLISPDGQTIYSSVDNRIQIFNMNIKYTLFLKHEKFLLGEKYSGNVAILNLTGASDYNLVDSESYKITKLSLLDVNIVPNQYALDKKASPLPSWITFDRDTDILTVEAKKQLDIGTYTLHSAFSLKIPSDTFKDLGTAKKPLSLRNLWAWLISLGYVDNELFLTANFGPEDTFYLPEEFDNYRMQIYNTLKQFYFETCTGFEVVSSLEVKEVDQKSVTVSTLSQESIKVEVKLEPKNGSEVKFVSCPYGSIVPIVKNHNKTKISLEGSLKEINLALNSIVVNFENGTLCDAHLLINDGFNNPVSMDLENISRYFKPNTAPKLNQQNTVQEQIDSSDIQTGKYFTFTLTNDIFEDDFAEGLDYELKMAQNNTAFPTWLSLNGLTLKGTPPKEVLGRDIDLILVAKNEFKQIGVPFTLNVKISLAFWLQLVLKYIPYVLTIVGLLVSANKIWNVLGKPYYKHFKEFHVGVDQDIGIIEPISFIKEELEQSQLIWKYLNKRLKGELLLQDKQRILDMIQEATNQMPSKERQKLTRYPSPIIDKIIVNRFILMQLESKNEAQTKSLFEELEPCCMEVVERDASSSSPLEFTINQKKLDELIERIRPAEPREVNETIEESLITNNEGVNIELLKDAILALAFKNHTLNILPIKLDIGVKQKVPANFLWRFLKLDLKDLSVNQKAKINYGIKCQIIDDQLRFYGITQNYFKGKTLVVQVKNRHQKIMKEIWIHGVEKDFSKDEILMVRDKQEVRGQNQDQGYEIY